MPTDPQGTPPEALILIAGMIIIFGGTLAINFIVSLFLPGLGQ